MTTWYLLIPCAVLAALALLAWCAVRIAGLVDPSDDEDLLP